jgi:hypothetical protein
VWLRLFECDRCDDGESDSSIKIKNFDFY